MIKARIERDANGTHRIICKRAKFKHWHELGKHRETDAAFVQSLKAGTINWDTVIFDHSSLFSKFF